MKTREEIISEINSLLAEEFEIEESEMAPDANLKDSYCTVKDSELFLQSTYKIKIPVEDLKAFVTFDDLYDYITAHLS